MVFERSPGLPFAAVLVEAWRELCPIGGSRKAVQAQASPLCSLRGAAIAHT